ncbi:MAG: GAF domain-containing protein, partial [Thermomicrobiaceae bacterium]|nr:GAF domain-containing protein [Thermomicrobiaceae bacterium]
MADDLVESILTALGAALGVPVRALGALPPNLRASALAATGRSGGGAAGLSAGGDRFLAQRYHPRLDAVVVLGPYRRPADAPGSAPVLDAPAEERAQEALAAVAAALSQALEERRRRLEQANRLESMSDAILAISSELGLETVLRRIVDLAREVAGARYAALGVPGPDGKIATFITSGLSPEEEARIGSPPTGMGVLGLLLREPRTIRLADIRSHPASVGFPPNHPPMTSFLGVPILAHGRALGNLYLTEKQTGREFTEEDAQAVETLARHAAVAIENARLYRERELERRRLELLLDQLPEAVVVVEPGPERVTLANRITSSLLGWEVRPPLPLEAFVARNPRLDPAGNPLPAPAIPLVQALRDGVTTAL